MIAGLIYDALMIFVQSAGVSGDKPSISNVWLSYMQDVT